MDEVHEHDAEVCAVIAAELVACTLGAQSRPELRTDLAGRLTHALTPLLEQVRRIFGAR